MLTPSQLPNIFAHRGGSKWAPENTLAAFSKCLKSNVAGIELDIRRCSTGELVVLHDQDLSRTTSGTGLIENTSYSQLKELSAGLWFGKEYQNEYVPLLKEVLDLIQGRLIVNIEIKNTPLAYPQIAEELLALISTYSYTDKLVVSSFDHKILQRIHRQAPQLKLGLLAAALFVDLRSYAKKIGVTHFHPAYSCLRPDVIEEAHQAGLEINTWTLNNPREWLSALRWGVDSITTDDPVALANYLNQISTASVVAF